MMLSTNKKLQNYYSGFVTFPKGPTRENINFWEEPVRLILEEVGKKDDRFKLNRIDSGSYYEKTKVIQPNEFDLMLEIEQLKLGVDDQYDGYGDNLGKEPPIGYTTFMIDLGEEVMWRKGGCIARGGNLLKATKVKALFAGYVHEAINKLNISDYNIQEIIARSQGPAVTLKIIHQDNTCCIDLTLAIKDESWPDDADEWETRPRRGWPPEELINAIVRDGCHLVGKRPRPASASESEYLWRYSFSTAEMKLVLQLEACCKRVLCILKALRENEHLKLDPLTSYHLKTIMFYEREENPCPSVWTGLDQVNVRFRSALDRLLTCLKDKRCPHYFIKDLNLFDDRFDNHYADLISQITYLKSNLNTILPNLIVKDYSNSQV